MQVCLFFGMKVVFSVLNPKLVTSVMMIKAKRPTVMRKEPCCMSDLSLHPTRQDDTPCYLGYGAMDDRYMLLD